MAKRQYDMTLFVKGNSGQYLDWTDMDSDLVLKDYGLTLLIEQGDGTWKDDTENKKFYKLYGDFNIDLKGLKEALNKNIKDCGFDNLIVTKIYVWTLTDREKPYYEE